MTEQLASAQWKAQRIKELLGDVPPHATIIDVGCGDGLLTACLASLFFEHTVIGVDTDMAVIAHAQRMHADVQFHAINQLNDITAYTPTILIASLMLHHVPRAEQQTTVHELMSLLPIGGMLIILEYNPYCPSVQLTRLTDVHERNATFISCNTLYQWLQTDSASVTHEYYLHVPTWLAWCERVVPQQLARVYGVKFRKK
ncbi:MAG: class I SAM-dependent methyltransferase [Candidatus Babeliales bacterium]